MHAAAAHVRGGAGEICGGGLRRFPVAENLFDLLEHRVAREIADDDQQRVRTAR